MKITTFTCAAALLLGLSTTAALAQIDARALADRYVAEGYSRVEVTIYADGIKVEAIRDAIEIEVLYDPLTGAVLESEVNRADADDRAETGVRIRDRSEDTRRGRDDYDRDDDSNDDDSYDDDGSDDDSSDDHGGRDHDDSDDGDDGDDHGGDDRDGDDD